MGNDLQKFISEKLLNPLIPGGSYIKELQLKAKCLFKYV